MEEALFVAAIFVIFLLPPGPSAIGCAVVGSLTIAAVAYRGAQLYRTRERAR